MMLTILINGERDGVGTVVEIQFDWDAQNDVSTTGIGLINQDCRTTIYTNIKPPNELSIMILPLYAPDSRVSPRRIAVGVI